MFVNRIPGSELPGYDQASLRGRDAWLRWAQGEGRDVARRDIAGVVRVRPVGTIDRSPALECREPPRKRIPSRRDGWRDSMRSTE